MVSRTRSWHGWTGILVACAALAHAQETTLHNRYQLSDRANGGMVYVTALSQQVAVSISTIAGDPATAVMPQIAAASTLPQPGVLGPLRVLYANGALETVASLIFAGSNIGLGIPPPPRNFTISYGVSANDFVCAWDNGSSSYDKIVFFKNGGKYLELGGNATSATDTFASGPFPNDPFMCGVQGFMITSPTPPEFVDAGQALMPQFSRPSNIGIATVISRSPLVVSEADDLPFSDGVTQNWSPWDGSNAGGHVVPNMGTYLYTSGKASYYQILQGDGASWCGGIKRSLLHVAPGSVIQLKFKVSTLGTTTGEWSYTIHAIPLKAGQPELNLGQLAGNTPLPNGFSGEAAAQIARFDQAHGTAKVPGNVVWVSRSTSDPAADNVLHDIIVPNDCDRIAIWLRIKGSGSRVKVGFDYLEYQQRLAP